MDWTTFLNVIDISGKCITIAIILYLMLFVYQYYYTNMWPYGLQPGALVIKRLDPLYDPPSWCSHLKHKNMNQPVINCLQLKWKFLAVKGAENSSTIKSHSFQLGEPWLKANMVLEMKDYVPQLHLEVAKEHVTRVLGRVEAFVTNGSRFESIICNANIVNGNRWILSRNLLQWSRVAAYLQGQFAPLNVTVNIEVAIIDRVKAVAFRELKHNSKICKDIGLSLWDKDSFDISVKVCDDGLGAHKFMLSARSPVLKAMLATDMLEGNTGVIELKDMSIPAAEAFLCFIYLARIVEKELFETAEELLAAANKYDMPDLHAVCENALRETIKVENAGRLLLLANLHRAPKLEYDALDFVKRNKAKVTASDAWKAVVAEHPRLMLDLFMD